MWMMRKTPLQKLIQVHGAALEIRLRCLELWYPNVAVHGLEIWKITKHLPGIVPLYLSSPGKGFGMGRNRDGRRCTNLFRCGLKQAGIP